MTIGKWTAVIDEHTCDECRLLHGKQFETKDTMSLPPLHGSDDPRGKCRCVIELKGDGQRCEAGNTDPIVIDQPTKTSPSLEQMIGRGKRPSAVE